MSSPAPEPMWPATSGFAYTMGRGYGVDAILTTLLVVFIVVGNVYFWVEPWLDKRRRGSETLPVPQEEPTQPEAQLQPKAAVSGEEGVAGHESEPAASLSAKDPADGQAVSVAFDTSGGAATVVDAAPRQRKPRLFYLDNIKSFLTVVVVVHHVVCIWKPSSCYIWGPVLQGPRGWEYAALWFIYLNQPYFMSMFFFISAYFVPSSFDRKGAAVFIRDRLRRIGLPLLFGGFFLVPVMYAMLLSATNPVGTFLEQPPYKYQWRLDQLWFLQWLMIFNFVYALIALETRGLKPIAMRLPGLTAIIALGIVLGLIHGAINSIQPRANNWWWDGTMFMPFLPLYCTWFTLGVVAKRNDWLHELQQWPAKKKMITYSLTALAMFVSCVWTATGTTVLFDDPPPLQTYTNAQNDFGYYLLLSTFQIGTYNVLMITSLLLLFGDLCNFTNKYLRFLSDASYTAYITHHWFLIPLAMSYMRILLAAGQPLLGGWYVVDGTLSSYWLMVGGWVYTAVLGLPLCFGVSWCLAKLPGLNQVL